MLGQLIGEGRHRKVYEYLPDNNWVVKVNKLVIILKDMSQYIHSTEDDANSAEYFYYRLLKTQNLHHFLCECKYDTFGNFLMKKIKVPAKSGEYEVPAILGDLSNVNLGMVENQITCLDYSWFFNNTGRTVEIKDNVMYHRKDETIIQNKKTRIIQIKGSTL